MQKTYEYKGATWVAKTPGVFVNYIATDRTGEVCGFATKPFIAGDSTYFTTKDTVGCTKLQLVGNWRDSIYKVPDAKYAFIEFIQSGILSDKEALQFAVNVMSVHRHIYYSLEESLTASGHIRSAFSWEDSPEGHTYWSDIMDAL